MDTKTIKQELAKAKQYLGDLSLWTIGIGRRGVDRDDLERMFREAGLDTDLVPERVDPGRAAQRAINRACRERGVTAKVYVNKPGAKAWAMVDVEIDDSSTIGDHVGELQNKALYDKTTEELHFQHDTELARAALDEYARGNMLTGEDVRRVVTAVLDTLGAIRMVGAGGDFFTAADQATPVRALRDAVNALPGCEYAVLPLPRTEDTMSGVGLGAVSYMQGEIKRLRGRVDVWTAGEANPRDSALHRRITEFGELRDELATLRDVLQLDATDLEADLERLTAACQGLLTGDAPEPEPESKQEQTPESGSDDTASDDTAADEDDGVPAAPTPPARPTPASDPATATLERMSLAKLRKLARDQGIAVKGLKKADLVQALESVL